ncbi:MAG: phage Gp37/Gp68 family protein [Eubacteriales bacterium]|nr:phage Gp37/Gp68 family protein [Eubacteriales bacterium]
MAAKQVKKSTPSRSAEWNPWHGCHKYSAGCLNCYVYRIDGRHQRDASIVQKTSGFYLPISHARDGSYRIPSGSMIWTCFTSDFLLEDADGWRSEAWRMIRERADCHFLFITKRIVRLEQCLPCDWGDGYRNVTICCTVENQAAANERLPVFREAKITHKIIVCEPLLERLDLSPFLGSWVDNVSVGGESGESARTCDYDWVLDIRSQCIAANVPFHFRQTGANFVKDRKHYRIPRKLQHSQARKANINTRSAARKATEAVDQDSGVYSET